jgi:hypothetical protein
MATGPNGKKVGCIRDPPLGKDQRVERNRRRTAREAWAVLGLWEAGLFRSRCASGGGRTGGRSPEGCWFVFGSGRQFARLRNSVGGVVDGGPGGLRCRGLLMRVVAEVCDCGGGADSLFRGGSDRFRGEPSDFRDSSAGLSVSPFSPTKWLTRPFGSAPVPNAL